MGKGERIEGFFYDDYNWTTQENTIKDDHWLAAIANRVTASESMAFQKYGQGIYERLNETIFSTYGLGFSVTKQAMEDDLMVGYEEYKNEDGEPCKDKLEIYQAKLKCAQEQAEKCDERVTYLAILVEKAKSDPAYRALLEVM